MKDLRLAHVLILEDNELLLTRLADILRGSDIFTAVSTASTIASCQTLLSEAQTDIFLADLHLPDGSGIDSIRLFKQINPSGIAIAISALSDGLSVMSALENGAVGYLHKDDPSLQILDSIKLARMGHSPMSSSIAYALVCRLQSTSPQPKPEQSKLHTLLTERETEVLGMIAKGLSYAETASVLNISNQTVPVHIRNIYKKLHANNRSEAVYEARAIGIIE